MGNAFDKNAPATGTSNGKKITVGVLAAVLLGVVFFHFNNAPKTAVAGEGAAADAGDITPHAAADQIAMLQQNPTGNLLIGKTNAGANADVPHNPFAVSAPWYKILVQVHVGIVPIPTEPKNNTAPVRVSLDLAKERDGMKLQGIFKQGGSRMALVNGTPVGAGATVKSTTTGDMIQINAVLEDRLQCQVVDREDGKFELKLPG